MSYEKMILLPYQPSRSLDEKSFTKPTDEKEDVDGISTTTTTTTKMTDFPRGHALHMNEESFPKATAVKHVELPKRKTNKCIKKIPATERLTWKQIYKNAIIRCGNKNN